MHMGIQLLAMQQDVTDTLACWNTWMRLGKDGKVLRMTGSSVLPPFPGPLKGQPQQAVAPSIVRRKRGPAPQEAALCLQVL